MHPFRHAVETRDFGAMRELFAEDVVFRSPVVFQPYEGIDALEMLLRAVAEVFEDFRYEREIGGENDADHALVFSARVGDREVQGCDFLHAAADGKIDEMMVMVRPLSGIQALAAAMKARLESAAG